MSAKFTPLAPAPPVNSDLDIAIKIETSSGWLDLQDEPRYHAHGDALATRQVSWRKRQVSSPFVDGSYTTAAVRENVQEALIIWVAGSTTYEYRYYQEQLTNALDQHAFRVMIRIDGMVEYWTCVEPADYTVEVQREFRHAHKGIVRAAVFRLPQLVFGAASMDES